MEWDMLEASKKLFPHWLDKSDNSNFTKHLKILNNQQRDIRHKLKCIDWSRLLNKPLQIHKTQSEPHKWKMEFEVNVPRLKQVNIYKNPTIVDNSIVNSYKVINGYYHDGGFYENHRKEITNFLKTEVEDGNHIESDIDIYDNYVDLIDGVDGKFYFDLRTEKYYKFENNKYNEVPKSSVPSTSLIHSESFIDNYSHFFRKIFYEDNSNEVTINRFVVDSDGNQKFKTILNDFNTIDNGKFELSLCSEKDIPRLFYNDEIGKYCIVENDEYVEVKDRNIIWIDYELQCTITDVMGDDGVLRKKYDYYYIDDNDNRIDIDIDNSLGQCFLFLECSSDCLVSKIPLIEVEDITPVISNDRYVLEVLTWDDFHFLKGYPEIDFIDYNKNNIIDLNERTYDNINIEIEKINNKEYLTFRVHQFGIKYVEVLKNEKPIHIADFLIDNYNHSTKETTERVNNNFAHIYNYNTNEVYYPYEKKAESIKPVSFDVDEYVWYLELSEDDKIYDSNGNFELKDKYDLKVTYYDSLHPEDCNYDKILTKSYVCEDRIFYHDVSLDVLGAFWNVPRHAFTQPTFDSKKEEIDFYYKTYPTFCNSLSEDDYHYQKRLEYYIKSYNKVYFPELELWKYFHIDSNLVNRKVIIAEQDYSYLRTLRPEENKYINELSKNKIESSYSNYEDKTQSETLLKPKLKSVIEPEDYLNSRNGILIDENMNYIKDVNGTVVRSNYQYSIDDDGEYVIDYEKSSINFEWYIAEEIIFDDSNFYQIKLTDLLKVVPNTRYQLRFCVKEYPVDGLDLKLIYKNNNGDVREVETLLLERKDYVDNDEEYNELIYTNYNTEWGVECEYICTDFITLDNAQSIEICLESKNQFQISDITLQRVTINHFDTEYMKTNTDYNSCVYDLYANYDDVPSNIIYEDLSIFNKILNRSLPLTKTGYFNFALDNPDTSNDMDFTTEVNIYVNDYNMIADESAILDVDDFASIDEVNPETDYYELTYNFNKYIKKGEYEVALKVFDNGNENNIISDFNIDINMLVFNDDNTASYQTLRIKDLMDFFEKDDDDWTFRIPFMNKSDNSFSIRVYRKKAFGFKDFRLLRKSPLTIEELIQ